MAVDLALLVPDVRAYTSPPGTDLFPNSGFQDWIDRLRNAFWDARLEQQLTNYTEQNGEITPISGTEELGRDKQQIIVLYAALNAVSNALRNLNTSFRAKAGPVEFETQNSANLLRDLHKELSDRRKFIISVLSDLGETPTDYIDAITARTDSISAGDTTFVTGWE